MSYPPPNTSSSTTVPPPPPPPSPMLRVMRLYSPHPFPPTTLAPILSLPDSFGVIYVGEVFRAYLGVLGDKERTVEGVEVKVRMQTPTGRVEIKHGLTSVYNIPPTSSQSIPTNTNTTTPTPPCSTIISSPLSELGPHTLRVTVTYKGGQLRKFYKFTVEGPVKISASVGRIPSLPSGFVLPSPPPPQLPAHPFPKSQPVGSVCVVSVCVSNSTAGDIYVCESTFRSSSGLEVMDITGTERKEDDNIVINKGGNRSFLFLVVGVNGKEVKEGDELGRAVVGWSKGMGERGRIGSGPVTCPGVGGTESKNLSIFPETRALSLLAPSDSIQYIVTDMNGPSITKVGKVESLKVRVGNYCNVRKSITMQYLPSHSCLPEGPTTVRVIVPPKESKWCTFKAVMISGGLGSWGSLRWIDEKGEEREGGEGGICMVRGDEKPGEILSHEVKKEFQDEDQTQMHKDGQLENVASF
mmetsp:Transcript_8888/g.17965  ORF Transcript_8888/g.17965 Transcript_8888/m.17965 type:complete len:468 (-) Transcript_8888:26-1429(-)